MDHREKPGSPGDILEHHGVKGMRWGQRKEEETSGDTGRAGIAAIERNEAAKTELAKHLKNPDLSLGAPKSPKPTPSIEAAKKKAPVAWHNMTTEQKKSVARNLTGTDDISKVDPESKHSRLTPNQKKAMLAVGVAGIGLAGFVAYKHYVGNTGGPGLSQKLAQGPLSQRGIGEVSKKRHEMLALSDQDFLHVNTSRGYADVRFKDGFKNPAVAARHADLIDGLERMREQFPAVRNMNIEVVPMSVAGPQGEMALKKNAFAAVMAIDKGEARIMYNDYMPELSAENRLLTQTLISQNLFEPGYMANHEMGHLLAAAHGDLPGLAPMLEGGGLGKQVKGAYDIMIGQRGRHKDTFKKYGLSYEELSKLSPYAATQPAEAMAELAGHYFTPTTRAKMDPALATKAKTMFDAMGGVT